MIIAQDPLNLCFLTGPGGQYGPRDVAYPVVPPIFPLNGQGWNVVVLNYSSRLLGVTTPAGKKWLPSMMQDVFGSGCDQCSVVFDLSFDDPSAEDSGDGGYIVLTWAQEPDTFRPDVYPVPLVGAVTAFPCGA